MMYNYGQHPAISEAASPLAYSSRGSSADRSAGMGDIMRGPAAFFGRSHAAIARPGARWQSSGDGLGGMSAHHNNELTYPPG